MYRKINQPKNKSKGNQPHDEIKSESADNSLLSIGNEGLNNIINNPFSKLLSEANEDNNIEYDGLSGMGEKDPDSEDENIISTREKPVNSKKIKEAKKQEEEINKEKDPAKIIEKIPDRTLDDLMFAIEDENPELDKDLVVEKPKRRNLSSKKRKKEENNSADEGSDLAKVNEDMEPVKGFNFTPIKLPDRRKVGKKDRFLSALAWYSGKTLGKLVGLIGNIIYWPLIHVPLKIYKKFSGKGKNKKQIEPEKFQKVRRHDLIPGWDGEKFQEPRAEDQKSNDPIEVDFRKIPGVWSNMIAAEAEDEHGAPLDPVITVYVNEPEEFSDDLIANKDIGHTFIGIDFSHFSNRTNRFERYNVKYGFFAPGGDNASSYIAGHYKNATVPGQLLNGESYRYDISRSFPAKPWQVNAIMKASETYADKGYSLYERNCTTFVRDMVVGTAHIAEAENILKPEEINLSHTGNAGTFLAVAFSANGRLGMENNLKTMAAQEDMSYERMGNQRVTKEEYDRYQKTRAKGGSWKKIGLSPNAAAENMRRYTSPGLGLLNAQLYDGKKKYGSYKFEDLPRIVTLAAEEVRDVIQKITPPELQDQNNVPEELKFIKNVLLRISRPIDTLINTIDDERTVKNIDEARKLSEYERLTPAFLKERRSELMTHIKSLNTLLFKYYKNDKRLHLPVLHLISLLNRVVESIDIAYDEKTLERTDDSDLGNLREEMMKKSYMISAGGKLVHMTPSHYESYLQIFKTPEKAVASYARFNALETKMNMGEVLTKDEKAEYAKLSRMEKLALDFDRSHNYMLDKQNYQQQDIDYAFALGVKEKKNAARGPMLANHRSSADTYKSIFLEKIFGGMRKKLMKNSAEGGIDEEQAGDEENIAAWLDEDMTRSVSSKMNEMKMILKALKNSIDAPDREKMYTEVNDLFLGDWFARLFVRGGSNSEKMKVLMNIVPTSFVTLMDEKNGKFPKLMQKLIDMVLKEDQEDSLMAERKRSLQGA